MQRWRWYPIQRSLKAILVQTMPGKSSQQGRVRLIRAEINSVRNSIGSIKCQDILEVFFILGGEPNDSIEKRIVMESLGYERHRITKSSDVNPEGGSKLLLHTLHPGRHMCCLGGNNALRTFISQCRELYGISHRET